MNRLNFIKFAATAIITAPIIGNAKSTRVIEGILDFDKSEYEIERAEYSNDTNRVSRITFWYKNSLVFQFIGNSFKYKVQINDKEYHPTGGDFKIGYSGAQQNINNFDSHVNGKITYKFEISEDFVGSAIIKN